MPEHSNPDDQRQALRAKLIGLGERSIRKSYYPELQKRLQDISEMNASLEQRVQQRTAELVAAHAAVERHAAQLRALARELTETEERERRRLAQLLHDHLQQILVAAKLRLGRVSSRIADETLRESLEQTADLIAQAVDESRSLTAELSPPVLYDVGLAGGLEWLARQMHERHGLRVDLDVDPEVAAKTSDVAVLIFQSIRELLFNVVKHAQTDAAHVRLACPNPNQIRVDVADQGIGFDPDGLREPGVRNGFGLFSIRERLSLLGGCLRVNSIPGKGTQMVLEVPVPEPFQAVPPSRAPLPQAAECSRIVRQENVSRTIDGGQQGRPIRVLLADDHPILRKGMADLLRESRGIEVVGEAANGEEAVELAHQTNPDVVLMDVTMPGVDGIQATRRITAEMPKIRVIGLSMHEKTDMSHSMLRAGASLYLCKSAPADELLAAVRSQVSSEVPDSSKA